MQMRVVKWGQTGKQNKPNFHKIRSPLWLAHEPARQGVASRPVRSRRNILYRKDCPAFKNIPGERKPHKRKGLMSLRGSNGEERNINVRSWNRRI